MNMAKFQRFFKAGGTGPVTPQATERIIAEMDLGNGKVLRTAVIEESKTFAAAASANLTQQLPAGAKVIHASLNLDTAVVLSTAVKLGLGFTADPDAFLLSSTTVAKNTKADGHAPDATGRVAAATTIAITAVDTNGAAAGTVTSGTVRARLVYQYATSIRDA